MKFSKEIIENCKTWPILQAQEILKKINYQTPKKGFVLFETGYGPSGLPHIGTFGEVARTTMVLQAFKLLAPEIPTRLYAFSDDLDGLRKVPDNLPNKEMIQANLGKPLTQVPDPYGEFESFGHNMNHRLRSFLDTYGFEYEFKSSSECYASGIFNDALLKVLEKYDEITAVIAPTLGDERRSNYSPFLPISPISGRVLQSEVIGIDKKAGTVIYVDEDGKEKEAKVTDGHCKLQWKPDWGMRWAAFEVDYEMHGKDLTPSAVLSSQMAQIINENHKTINFVYELFLDEEGKKISKSKGNGVSMDQWLEYAPKESLSLFNYSNPQKAKKLYLEIIPKQMDEYLTHLTKFKEQDEAQKLNNPVFYIHAKEISEGKDISANLFGLSFSLLLNLATVCNPENKDVLWGFISKYAPNANAENSPLIDQMASYAVNYYNDFIKPNKKFRLANENEKQHLKEIVAMLEKLPENAEADFIQNAIYDIGMKFEPENLRGFFASIYEIILGQEQGPRLGSFIKLYGTQETIKLMKEKIGE